MFEPMYSPWGNIQTCKILTPGVFEVTTASHGGIMVSLRNLREQLLFSPTTCVCSVRSVSFPSPYLLLA